MGGECKKHCQILVFLLLFSPPPVRNVRRFLIFCCFYRSNTGISKTKTHNTSRFTANVYVSSCCLMVPTICFKCLQTKGFLCLQASGALFYTHLHTRRAPVVSVPLLLLKHRGADYTGVVAKYGSYDLRTVFIA